MRVAILMALLCAFAYEVHAQQDEGAAIRFQMGAGWASYSGGINACGVNPAGGNVLCPDYVVLDGGAFTAASLGLDYAVSPKFHVGGDFGVTSMSASAEHPGQQNDVTIKGKEYTVTASFHGTARSVDLYPRLYASYYLPFHFFVELGLGTLINLSNNVTSEERIATPGLLYFDSISTNTSTFLTDDRQVLKYDQSLESFSSFRPFIDIGIGQSYTVTDFTIQLIARYQMGFNSGSEEGLSNRQLGFNVIGMFRL